MPDRAAIDPALAAAIDDFLLELRVERGLSPLTIEAYRRDLRQFGEGAGTAWRDDPATVTAFVTRLRRQGRRATTQARKVAAIRSFYGFARREGIIERNLADLIDPPRPGRSLPEVLAPDEVERILAAPGDDPLGVRDRAILELLYACGLRVSELTGLDLDRLNLDGLELRVIGKGNKERRVPMGEPARDRVHRYLGGPRATWTAGHPSAGRVRVAAGDPARAGGGVAPGAALEPGRRHRCGGHAAHLSTLVCDPPAGGRRRSAGGPGPLGPC